MLKIKVPDSPEYWDEVKEEFFTIKGTTLQLEHSLVSISKWESKWHKPYLLDDQKTNEEVIDYVRCMTLTQNVDPQVYYGLSEENLRDIAEYINDSMTATWFSKDPFAGPPHKKEVITSEIIYYWMIKLNIPVEFQKWHLNRLITLIKVFEAKDKDTTGKKVNKRKLAQDYAALNAARRKAFNSKG